MHREKERMGKGGQRENEKARETRQKNAEKGVSQSVYDELGGNNEEGMGQNNGPTLPFRPSTNSNLNIHPPSLVANTPPSFDICFPF